MKGRRATTTQRPAVFALGVLLLAQAGLAVDNPVAYCAFTDKPPVIDGDLSDACWKKAESAGGFYRVNSEAPAKLPTKFMARYDRTHLYLAVIAQEEKPIDPRTRQDTEVIRDRYVGRYSYELFLAPRGSACYQLVWDYNGIRWDSDWMDGKWNGRWTVKMRIDGNKVYSELSIEVASLGVSAMEAGAQWGFNLVRNAEKSPDSSCWSAISGAFHNSSAFGMLLIGSREVYWRVQSQALQQRLQTVMAAHGRDIDLHPCLHPLADCAQREYAAWEKAAYPDESARWGAYRQVNYRVEALEIFFEWKQQLNGGFK